MTYNPSSAQLAREEYSLLPSRVRLLEYLDSQNPCAQTPAFWLKVEGFYLFYPADQSLALLLAHDEVPIWVYSAEGLLGQV